jgi:hypothetical protein
MAGMTMMLMGTAARVVGKELESADEQAALSSEDGLIDAESEEVDS